MDKTTRAINKKKKFVADGVFNAELHSFFSKSLQDAGYAGIEVRRTPTKTEIRIKATKPQQVIGVEGKKHKELTQFLQKRFGYSDDQIQIWAEPIKFKGLCASAQVEAMNYKLLKDVPVRLAANYIIKSVIQDGAKGCEIIISGKLKQQRAKTMKFKQGYMICTGQPKNDYIDVAVRHVFFKQGIMGVKVKIMLPYEPNPAKKFGVKTPIPDNVIIHPPKQITDDKEIRTAVEQQQPAQPEQQQ
ncbi:40S ribosomal protein S3 (macronuclear) [Tetrahymena thermophila SB210]|uniref:40S ribosomal protein S3 n=2 Tax=Tetrahymena thermophila TaxID=5911 RepID=Q22AV9_TETTS|nr:40S ribosomal protein S3 [Tetrahymena thermophila SB210]2XZN_C Chain C, Kh Domain Containing Protein [Tetrahymena thermophila]4BPN_C Chain C, 40s Ribosomal Protein Rps3e [Tetrahymena thermophila]4BPO_C Chain C, 40s Ribosomal Protein Rps3e [Tetrahymena thermophila]4BTS_AC Chain AC, 40S RIBOSOMAL PROTEIN RPS3E [Tetrahymena thermophila]4BTS_BC Chain BC, 40S RIBOSOMAL PROTEIN RPS3E [Tetrahymena thermophila]4BTS_CC Chain CC, 40S RIBOSOMAL PROTEIN RPS3E [Tetrahymena thermophila]4BTS_DC Chain DC|eukprot:XP_001030083.3 40S ribosomal protein S3 [Tetrahymena thermophila SB210]